MSEGSGAGAGAEAEEFKEEDGSSREKEWEKLGIWHNHPKTGPSTSSGRFFFPRAYYEPEGIPGQVGMGCPKGPAASILDMRVQQVADLRELDLERDLDGWFVLANGIRIHADDTSVLVYSDTVLKIDPEQFVPDPRPYNSPFGVTTWGIRKRIVDRELFASALMYHENLGTQLYPDPNGGRHFNPNLQFIKILERRKSEFLESDEVQSCLGHIYILKIELYDNEGYVWRRFRVPASIDLAKLDDQVIVPVMGWSRCHKAHVFEDPKDGSLFGSYPAHKGKHPAFIDAMCMPNVDHYYTMDDRNVPVAILLRKIGDICYYTHDLGEQYVHRITLEEVCEDSLGDRNDMVSLMDGAGACPPESGFGIEGGRGCLGYAGFVGDFTNNPRKPKVREALRKIKRADNYISRGAFTKFDPFFFDLEAHRQSLQQALAGPSLRVRGALGSTRLEASFSGCAGCGNRLSNLRKCTGCMKVAYCSSDCQLNDWKQHKKVCKKKKGKSAQQRMETVD